VQQVQEICKQMVQERSDLLLIYKPATRCQCLHNLYSSGYICVWVQKGLLDGGICYMLGL